MPDFAFGRFAAVFDFSRQRRHGPDVAMRDFLVRGQRWRDLQSHQGDACQDTADDNRDGHYFNVVKNVAHASSPLLMLMRTAV
jgi:hypothetical protein